MTIKKLMAAASPDRTAQSLAPMARGVCQQDLADSATSFAKWRPRQIRWRRTTTRTAQSGTPRKRFSDAKSTDHAQPAEIPNQGERSSNQPERAPQSDVAGSQSRKEFQDLTLAEAGRRGRWKFAIAMGLP